MPVTKTAKRAQRSSKKKEIVNKRFRARLDIAIRLAKRNKKTNDINQAISLVDKACKNKLIHKNKASRLKSSLTRLLSRKNPSKKLPKK
ncbi:hypothetical protein A2Z22_04980 [Candidatus Woesebacteria bacterium RBG_16_34_12]|uniref:Small ribosomal subunit protein bS20 n=1 Tax=Candidatus Woesebacteria bacterium RBG_16_34_12 TaxID=1802480 RepID=A0A1F7X9L1_9BACT|nr:MAG: hypothetical protein A2Z22_04980 [Candidatus Woesebacteria bacterium RBG_16_34_12]